MRTHWLEYVAAHIVKSTQGLMRIAPDGRGYPSSRRYNKVARQSPPPALSPAKICHIR